MANKAAWLTAEKARPFKVDDAPMPVPKANEVSAVHDRSCIPRTSEGSAALTLSAFQVVVRNHAVAINPTDWGMQAMAMIPLQYPYIEGEDAAGEVTAVGSAVKDFKVGDRVTALCLALDRQDVAYAAFQLFFVVEENAIAKIPDHVSYTEACVLPLCISTAASALFQSDTLALPLPHINPKPTGKVVLVWGGSSSLGACAIQLVRGAGYDVATTASSHNLEYCKAIGAKYAFDHTRESVVEDIITALKDVDFGGVLAATFMAPEVTQQCGQVASKLGGHKFVATVLAPAMPLPDDLPQDVKFSKGEMSLSTSAGYLVLANIVIALSMGYVADEE